MTSFLFQAVLFAACLLAASGLSADTLLLHCGGKVVGRWVNRSPQRPPRYVFETRSGVRLTVDARRVADVRIGSGLEARFATIAADYADTAEGQWRLAQWCLANDLPQRRRRALERVVQLEADHADARQALGYRWYHGRWILPDDELRRRGLVRHRGRWRLPQDVALEEARRRRDERVRRWHAAVRRLQQRLRAEPGEAAAELAKIDDPLALPALSELIRDEPGRAVRQLAVETMGRIPGPAATQQLAKIAAETGDLDTYDFAVRQLLPRRTPALVEHFVEQLESNNNRQVNRAAMILGELGDASAAGPLIDALVTTHWHSLAGGGKRLSSPERVLAPAASVPQFAMGVAHVGHLGDEPVVWRTHRNQPVLDALCRLAGDQGFGFRQQGWRTWLKARENLRRRPPLRRDP